MSPAVPEQPPQKVLQVMEGRKRGGNIFKDRRMEYRIRMLKRLISNIGPNFDEKHVQLINKIVEIKEQLFYTTRGRGAIIVKNLKYFVETRVFS